MFTQGRVHGPMVSLTRGSSNLSIPLLYTSEWGWPVPSVLARHPIEEILHDDIQGSFDALVISPSLAPRFPLVSYTASFDITTISCLWRVVKCILLARLLSIKSLGHGVLLGLVTVVFFLGGCWYCCFTGIGVTGVQRSRRERGSELRRPLGAVWCVGESGCEAEGEREGNGGEIVSVSQRMDVAWGCVGGRGPPGDQGHAFAAPTFFVFDIDFGVAGWE